MHGRVLHIIKNRSTEPVLIWRNITLVVNVVFDEIIGIDKSKVHGKQLEGNCAGKNVVISNIQMQMVQDKPVFKKK